MSLPVALELYSVRDLYREDFDACLEKTAAIGYTGVECFGAPTLPADKVVESLRKHGLTLVSWHTPIDILEGDAFVRTLAYFQQVGCTRVVVPSIAKETFATREAVLAFAKRLTDIQARLAPYGIDFGYHNHAVEFIPLPDGTLPWSVLMDATTITAQLDNGNALASKTPGLDTVALVGQWPGRARTVHLKPYSSKNGHDTMIGEDDIDWAGFIAKAEKPGGAAWLIVEYESAMYEQFDGVTRCLHALKAYL